METWSAAAAQSQAEVTALKSLSEQSCEGFLSAENCCCLILPFHYEILLSIIKAPPPLRSDRRGESSGACGRSHFPTKCPDGAVEVRGRRPAEESALSEQLVRVFMGEAEGAKRGTNCDRRRTARSAAVCRSLSSPPLITHSAGSHSSGSVGLVARHNGKLREAQE